MNVQFDRVHLDSWAMWLPIPKSKNSNWSIRPQIHTLQRSNWLSRKIETHVYFAPVRMIRKFHYTQPIVVASNWFCTLFLIVGLVMIPILNLVLNHHTFTNNKWTQNAHCELYYNQNKKNWNSDLKKSKVIHSKWHHNGTALQTRLNAANWFFSWEQKTEYFYYQQQMRKTE